MISKALVVDLDGTLLHPEPAAIAVWGRSGYRYMSGETAALLARLARTLPVVIATGRNGQSVARLTQALFDLPFAGFVLENGLVARDRPECGARPEPCWDRLYERLDGWERLRGYERCLGLIYPPELSDPQAVVAEHLDRIGLARCHLYQERHKLFVYRKVPCKYQGLAALNLDPFIALGDGTNDLTLLEQSAHPMTLCAAHPRVRELVAARQGYCSRRTGHAGAKALLHQAERVIGGHL